MEWMKIVANNTTDKGSISKIYKQVIQLNSKKKKKKRKRPKQTFLQGREMDGKQAHEKVLNIANYQRNANRNYNEVSLQTGQNGHNYRSTNNKCWRGCGEDGTSYTVDGNLNW